MVEAEVVLLSSSTVEVRRVGGGVVVGPLLLLGRSRVEGWGAVGMSITCRITAVLSFGKVDTGGPVLFGLGGKVVCTLLLSSTAPGCSCPSASSNIIVVAGVLVSLPILPIVAPLLFPFPGFLVSSPVRLLSSSFVRRVSSSSNGLGCWGIPPLPGMKVLVGRVVMSFSWGGLVLALGVCWVRSVREVGS